jgi:hypothetical protein
MRIFTGSERMLRELKMSTPKEEKKTSLHIMEKEFPSGKDQYSKRILTSQPS